MLDDGPVCSACGCDLERELCDQCQGEGYRDSDELMEEDPLWYEPGDTERCSECSGKGGWWYCPNAKYHSSATSNIFPLDEVHLEDSMPRTARQVAAREQLSKDIQALVKRNEQIHEGYPTEQEMDEAKYRFVFREPSGTYGWAAAGCISYGYATADEAWEYAQKGQVGK